MELRHLRQFLAVAETEHFGRAADGLHIAGPALSRTVRQLEDHIGTPLFERTTRQVQLTEAGRVFAGEVRSLLAELEDAVGRARLIGEGASGVLRVGVTGSASYGVLPRVVRRLKAELPDVELAIETELLTPIQAAALTDGRLDLALLRTPVAVAGIDHRVLFSEPLILALPDGHRFIGDRNVTVADLHDESFVTYPADTGSVVDGAVVRTCAAAGFTPRRTHQVAQTSTLLALVAAGLGIALVPRSASSVRLTGVRFESVPDTERVELAIAWRAGDDSPLLARVLQALGSADLTEEEAAA
ncbi:LysR family transcriptional regulator [Tsukamurella asaccharolytica]|uniref:LysR family transcriptional regulator n=1 Tax=Tsukamurella asaccharolytica TaxID=2592067 RepID=A0A5C5RFW0_9ACTN|nr:LysR family transcriptional regulator [Tsukamurella asaccharolytica]TWS21562.1 LysR family transcriptional regulator [Tsukamurella asaccharolytica]